MIKTNYLKFKKSLETTGKSYFNQHDLKKFYCYQKNSLKVLLSSWSSKELIHHLGRGYYAFDLTRLDYLALANELDQNSYISFEYALYYYNLTNQVPTVVTLATKNRSRVIKIKNWTFEYTHLKDDLHFDYELRKKIYIATPEKALADLIYLMARGQRIAELDSLEKKKIDQKKLQSILKRFPDYVGDQAKRLALCK
jgi:predicted transcriptional regulator of viral defense system